MNKYIAAKIQERLEKINSPVSQKDSMAGPSANEQLQEPKIDFDRLQHQLLNASMGPYEIQLCIADVREGRVYTFKNITTMLHCSKNKARLLFRDEPGVVRLGTDYRVPDTVFRRVVNQLMRRRG
jgi:hypothetical protein